MSDENPRVAVCPGSYDPVTNGHLDVISRAAKVFDKVLVGVVNNPVRKEKTLFTADERKAVHRGRHRRSRECRGRGHVQSPGRVRA